MSNGAVIDKVMICDRAKCFFIYAIFSGQYSGGISIAESIYADRAHSSASGININLTSLPINMRYRKASLKSSGRVAKFLV